MKTTHTPGPWKIIECSGCFIAHNDSSGEEVEFAGEGYQSDKARCREFVETNNAISKSEGQS